MSWRQVRLKRLFESAIGGTWGSEPAEGDVTAKCIRGTDLDFDRLRIAADRAPLRGFTRNDMLRRAVTKGDIVIETAGGGEHQPVGRAALHASTELAVPTNFAARLRPAPGIDSQFAVYVCASLYFRGLTRSCIKQTTGIQNLDLSALLNLPVAAPTLSEQRAIADFLDAETARIDALIAKKRRMIQAVDERFISMRAALLLGDLDPSAGPRQASVQEHAALGVLMALQRGHDLPAEARVDGSVPVVSSGGISGSHDVAAVAGPGVVTGRYGTVGEVYFVETDYWPLNTTLYVKDFRGNWPRWTYYMLGALPLDIDAAKSAVTGINRNVIGQLRAPVLSVSQQKHLAEELDAAEQWLWQVTNRLTRQIALLREHRQALITAAVTGEMEVPGVAA